MGRLWIPVTITLDLPQSTQSRCPWGSQQALAEKADLNIRNVQRIEAGEIDVLLSTAVRVAAALDCPLAQLVPKAP